MKNPDERDTFKDSPLEHSRSVLGVASVAQNAVGHDACKLKYFKRVKSARVLESIRCLQLILTFSAFTQLRGAGNDTPSK